MRFQGKIIIVTGAAQGMGEAVARRLAQEGASLVLVDRSETVENLAIDLGARALVGDVTDDTLAADAVSLAIAETGALHGLAHVAGVHAVGDALTTSRENWDRLVAVNMTAPWLWSQAAIPAMLESGGGSIVVVTSINSSFVRPSQLPYNASKAGALGVVRSVAVDFGREGIRCNSVSPGSVETPMLLELFERRPETRTQQVERNFAGRIGRPDEVAACCAFLLSNEAEYVNGADLRIDGARTVAI